MEMEAISALERRLDSLEKAIFGNSHNNNRNECESSAVDQLLQLARIQGNAVDQKGDRIAPLLRRCPEIDAYLDPRFAEDQMATSVKTDLILAQEEKIKKTAEMLTKISQAEKVLNGKAFNDVSDFEAKLNCVTMNAVEQERKFAGLERETVELIAEYNEIMDTISQSFLACDKKLTQLEEQSKK